MAVVTVSVTDSAPVATKWEMPPNYEGLRSPIPRGLITYAGTDAIATLTAGDETTYQLSLVMPPGFAYLPKMIQVLYRSDDLDANFNNLALGFYLRAIDKGTPHFSLQSPGEIIRNALDANIVWAPLPVTPKLVLQASDSMGIQCADMAPGGSSAGDMFYFMQFYVFDVDQVDKWEVNTPIPIISHTAF